MTDISQDPTEAPVVAQLVASPPRRYIGTGMLGMLGFLLFYLAFSAQQGGSQAILILFAMLAMFSSYRLFQASAQVIELTTQQIRVQSGDVLAELSNIKKVERGAFSFKPSNGFLVTLKENGKRRWAPGMYWSFSRQLGIGGVTGAPQTKGMAEAIAILIAEREIAAREDASKS